VTLRGKPYEIKNLTCFKEK